MGYNKKAQYGQHGAPSGYHQPSRRVATRDNPIDLTADSPPKAKQNRGQKRKSTTSGGEIDAATSSQQPTKKQKAKSEEEEKRLRRFRPKAPINYEDVHYRALSQRMFVIDRQRHSPSSNAGDRDLDESRAHPTETIKMAGTTGNIYTITIDKVPSCDCPHARKGNQCKHVVYVLARVLRAPLDLQYQLAFLSSELRQIFAEAPPLPSETAATETETDGRRKPIEGECPICCEDFEPNEKDKNVVYCKAACGNNVHRECFCKWAATKTPVTCPFCRSTWEGEKSDGSVVKSIAKSGRVNQEGYVNVASQLGLSGQRDYSTYNDFWLRRQGYN